LPAENAAISHNLASEDWTYQNIEHMKKQLIKLGISFDWNREVTTCSSDYYRWTQYIFLKLYEHGFLYRKEALVNWDPVDKTVLAEEQVDANGCSWRSGAKVEKKPLRQWFIKTTKLSHSLSEGLEEMNVADWGDIIKLQKHWIGECNGYNFELPLAEDDKITTTVWTVEPESLKTSVFVAVKTCHILNKPEWRSPGSNRLSIHIRIPFSNRLLPVFVVEDDKLDFPEGSDIMLGDPASDEKASQLANHFSLSTASRDGPSGEEICKQAQAENWGGYRSSSKLRDWLVSRQRFWGTPIPMIHCHSCGTQPVPFDQLPVQLPPSGGVAKGHSALLLNQEFLNVDCPKY